MFRLLILMICGFLVSAGKPFVPYIGSSVRPDMVVQASELRDGYECRKIEFFVETTERVTGYLLVPDAVKEGKCPAVVMLHDHGARFDVGKEKLVRPIYGVLPFGEEDHICVSSRQWVDKYFDGVYLADSLATLGYVVLVTDALYWGDRSSDDAHRWSELTFGTSDQFTNDTDRSADEKTRRSIIKSLKKSVYEGQRTVYSSLQDKDLVWAEKILRDDVASVRLLASLPYVDSDKIGAFGFSMGAHRCWLLSAFCKQVCCGVAVSWMTTLNGYDGNNASDLSMRIQSMRDEMDFGDIGKYLSPKPMLFLSGETDHLFPKDKVQTAYDLLHSHYKDSTTLSTDFFPGGHHCGKPVQKMAVEFYEEWLK